MLSGKPQTLISPVIVLTHSFLSPAKALVGEEPLFALLPCMCVCVVHVCTTDCTRSVLTKEPLRCRLKPAVMRSDERVPCADDHFSINHHAASSTYTRDDSLAPQMYVLSFGLFVLPTYKRCSRPLLCLLLTV